MALTMEQIVITNSVLNMVEMMVEIAVLSGVGMQLRGLEYFNQHIIIKHCLHGC